AADVTPIYVGIDMDRDTLNARINARCDAMWRSGLIEETQRVLDMGVDPFAQSLQTVGYVEAIAVINGIMSLDDAQEKLRIATRRYAKRQHTWFRRDERIHWIKGSVSDFLPLVQS
ncbi:MAG: tRNA (adenosine(37)-N6)-dimethylallyltransferase MiaA, partial [Ignavibacteriae bacterium]